MPHLKYSMFGKQHHYVVVLKWKRGESAALATLSPKARRFLTPFIELVSVPTDLDTGEQTMALDKHVGTALDRIVKCWGTTDPFFLDPIKVYPFDEVRS